MKPFISKDWNFPFRTFPTVGILRAVLCGFILSAVTGRAQAPAWAAAKFQYDCAVATAHAQELAERQKLADLHTNQLNAVKLRAQQAGDLDGVKFVLAELERFGKSQTAPPPESAPTPELRHHLFSLGQGLKSAEQRTAREVVRAAADYEKTLLDLQTALTKDGKIEDAKAVREERARAAASADLAAAREVLNGRSSLVASLPPAPTPDAVSSHAAKTAGPAAASSGGARESLEKRLVGTRWSYPPGKALDPQRAFIRFREGGKITAEWNPTGEEPKAYVWQVLPNGTVSITWRDRHRIFSPDAALKEGPLVGPKDSSVMQRMDAR